MFNNYFFITLQITIGSWLRTLEKSDLFCANLVLLLEKVKYEKPVFSIVKSDFNLIRKICLS